MKLFTADQLKILDKYTFEYEPQDASILGVYLHGLAGDLAAKKNSMESLVAGEIIQFSGKAFRKIWQ